MRWANHDDYTELGDVMFDAVRNGSSLYSEAHRQAWAPAPRYNDAWIKRLSEQHVAVGEAESELSGFITMRNDGYIDLAFIRPAAQGTGLFRKLYGKVEDEARTQAIARLWTHASLMAQPAFTAVGFDIVKHEVVDIGGLKFARAEMQKRL